MKHMKQRILIILLTLLTTMTAMADGTEPELVASPASDGSIAFASDQNHNNLVVTPNPSPRSPRHPFRPRRRQASGVE